MASIAALIMVKNEETSILTTLESIRDEVDGIILFDTGSTDKTIDVVRDVAEKSSIKFHLLTGEFEDFSTSRNKLLQFANDIADTENYDFFLLLDSNDELRINNNNSLKYCLNFLSSDYSAFLIKQQWFIGTETIEYYNIRLIRSKQSFRYKGAVHEYLEVDSNPDKFGGFVIYQDRTKGSDMSRERWKKDMVLLEKELKNNPTDGRTQYYLAQTYDCLNMRSKAKKMYTMRAKNCAGFQEERFISMMRIPKMTDSEELTDKCDAIKWYFNAYFLLRRAEPLVEISRIYRGQNELFLSYSVAKIACGLKYPDMSTFLVNKKCYSHDRWHELGISAFYVGKFKEGKKACLTAIDSGIDVELNKSNLQYYLNAEEEGKKEKEDSEDEDSEDEDGGWGRGQRALDLELDLDQAGD